MGKHRSLIRGQHFKTVSVYFLFFITLNPIRISKKDTFNQARILTCTFMEAEYDWEYPFYNYDDLESKNSISSIPSCIPQKHSKTERDLMLLKFIALDDKIENIQE